MRVEEPPQPHGPVEEAEENLRVIRDLMERSTRYSTFSGVSGVFAGGISIVGCLAQQFVVHPLPASLRTPAFLLNWALVVALAVGVDFALTKRKAPRVGKRVLSRLGRQMAAASLPGLGTGALLTLFFVRHGMADAVYPFWMLTYGIAVSAVGLFSQREVGRLGCAFLAAGALTLAAQALLLPPALAGPLGLAMVGVSFGGFHIAYAVAVSRREGW